MGSHNLQVKLFTSFFFYTKQKQNFKKIALLATKARDAGTSVYEPKGRQFEFQCGLTYFIAFVG
jgi:hypothetical protein